MPDVPPMIRQQQILSEISRWAAGQGTPGWDQMQVHLTARGRAWDVGFVVRHGTRSTGWVGPVEPGGPLQADADELRQVTYRHPVGAPQSAIVTLGATGWPDPRISMDASFNYDDEPHYVVDDQPRVSAEDLVDDYSRFPRTRAATPAWVLERVQSAGLRLPFVEEPAPPAPDWSAGTAEDAAATVGSQTDETVPAREEQTLPSAERAALTERPADIDLLVDRDGIPPSDGRRPHQRRGRIDGRASWRDILVSIGTPLVLVDGAGVWVVVRRAAGFADVVVGVVEQTAITTQGLPEVSVHPVSGHDPWELADADAHLELHYLSVPGPVEEVLEAAHDGHVWQRPATRGVAPDNAAVRAALAAHEISRDQRGLETPRA
ncbi:hypothetical protein [Georgenia subflava]|uniref:Uncharacterized protein n=1 Tax=Georgenia subflava TaxID=1622177 RepID=A0A6N7EHV7_9MICO|nr:hypothetical protein [Georgenia subflava]MPV37972.1 hypothetical protein [Georgenia subflava]